MPGSRFRPCRAPGSGCVRHVFDRVVVRILLRGRTPIALARVYFWGARKKDGKVKTPDVIT